MTNFNNADRSPVEDGPYYDNTYQSYYDNMYNDTWIPSGNYSGTPEQYFNVNIIPVFLSVLCIIGLVGNGIVIFLLGFHIQRSPFTTYILNLAVADFGVLLFVCLMYIFPLSSVDRDFAIVASTVAICMYNASQFILTTISIDRCVSVLFPIWYRCHRPQHLSTIVCVLIWVLACLLPGSLEIIRIFLHHDYIGIFYQCIVGAVLCLPLVSISTMILLFKVFCKSQQPRRGRILTIVLLTLLFFLIFASPLNAIITDIYFSGFGSFSLLSYGYPCACLNSCVNPVIYYMVGRKKRGQGRKSLKVILQRAFKEEEEYREQ